VAEGAMPLENPTSSIGFYGYLNDGPMIPAPGDVQTPTHNVEASKTEPDKNTYLVVSGQHGADPDYDYGTHFLYQGHETAGMITRVNLDADAAHRITLLASQEADGSTVPTIDGSTWNPFTQRLLFTVEGGARGGALEATLDFPSSVHDLYGSLGQGGFEGIQLDSSGNIYIVEDSGGAAGTVNTHAKQPNSFLFRFLPNDVSDLSQGGILQALQVISLRTGSPIVFHAGQADADILSDDVKDLHTYGLTFKTHWITVHNTASDGTAPFSANAAAKAHGATPFKRPENGIFRPGTKFEQFDFTETGDTNSLTEAGSQFGGFGSIMALKQSPDSNDGTLRLLYNGDIDHNSFDNIAFFDKDHLLTVEDRGDGLHSQANELDSGWQLDPRATGAQTPLRWLAEGRDPAATIDSGIISIPMNGFQNEGDNEITGIHVSNGDPTIGGLLGAAKPTPFKNGWRVFWTQQHGQNLTWEVEKAKK
jgi:hypothetical protein